MKRVLYIFLILSSVCFGQRADFFREDITFQLDGKHLDVNGFYWFANNSEKPVYSEIYYPFPNYNEETIDSIRLYNLSAGQKPGFSWEGKNGISFQLYVAPYDTVLFQIGYRQELKGDSATYILRTTQGWGKPISLAEYKLIIPESLRIRKYSYTPDKSYTIEKKKVYYWKKENFMPEQDMIFYFE